MTGDAASCVLQKMRNVGIYQRVPDPNALFATADDPGLVENRKMLGHVLLNAVDSDCQLLDSRLAELQMVQQ